MLNKKTFTENKSSKILSLLGIVFGIILGFFLLNFSFLKRENLSFKTITNYSSELINIVTFIIIFTSFSSGILTLFLKKNRINLLEISEVIDTLESFRENTNNQTDNSILTLNNTINSFSSHSKVKKLWCSYKDSFLPISSSSEQFHQTVDADYFFNEETLLKEELKYKVYLYLPQLFLGIGIFGTFIGLAMGLKGLDLTSTDTKAMQESVKHLLKGVEVSFFTSVFGIYFSIAFSIIINFFFEHYEKKILELKNGMNEHFIRNKNEKILLEVKEELSKIRISNDELAHKLANELGEKLGTLTNSISDIMNKFTNQVGGDLSSQIKDVLDKLFNEGLVKNFGEITEKLISTLELSSNHTKELPLLLEQILKQFEVSKENIAVANQNNTKLQEETAKQVSETLEGAISRINEIFETTNKNIETTAEKVVKNFDSTNDKVNLTSDKLENIFEIVKETNSEALLLAKEIKETFSQKESFENISSIFTKIEEISNIFQKKINSETELKNMWMSFGEEFKNTNNSLVKSFEDYREQITKGTGEFREIIKDLHNHYEQSLGKQTKDYSTVVAQGTAGLFQQYDANLSDVINKFHGVLRVLDEKLGSLEIIMKQNQDSLNSYLDKIEKMNKK